jgi:aerotaxis receptor
LEHLLRNNQPVTQQGYTLSADQTLVSVTDLKGRITYCNASFIEASGFERQEILGQAHNMVRHPDMPEEAFRDMWDTIQAQLPWSGLVKNRRKNGDYYWVQANATPMMDGNTITGFLSVRTAPSRQDVAQAEELYARMRSEAKAGKRSVALHRGAVVRKDPLGRLLAMLRLGVMGQVLLVQLCAFVLVLLAMKEIVPDALAVPAVALGMAFGAWRIRVMVLLPMHSLVRDANRLASGDLSQRVTTGERGPMGSCNRR